jgi:hypothetical protein
MAPPAAPKKPTLQQQIDDLKRLEDEDRKNIAREKKHNIAQDLLHEFYFKVIGKVGRWTVCANNISIAYVRAAKNHRDALSKVDKINNFRTSLVFSAISLLTSGAFSLVWGAAVDVVKQQLLNPLKDTVSAGFGGIGNIGPAAVVLPGPADAPKTTTDDAVGVMINGKYQDMEPEEFKTTIDSKVQTWVSDTHLQFANWERDMRLMDDSAWDNWDQDRQQQAYDDWWAKASKWWGMKDTSQTPTEQEKHITDLAKDAERVMWANWIPRLKTESIMTSGGNAYDWGYAEGVGEKVANYEGVKGPIEERFTALNILQEAGTTISMWHSAESEDTKLINWAANFLQKANGMWNS